MTPEEGRLAAVRGVGEEVVEEEEELRSLLASKPNPVVFHAVVPSGRMPLSQGILTAMKLNALTSAGCSVKVWIDDCLAETNNELGSDMKKIQKVSQSYVEIWKSLGVRHEKVEFLSASKETELRIEYWEMLMDVATKNFVEDVERSFQVTGQNAEDVLSAAQIIHRSRQCTDILFLKADICWLSMDQRDVGILTREYCGATNEKRVPIILSNIMLPALQKVQENMPKNDPPCIYMDDEEAEVNVKIKQAFCPPMIVEGNPCLEHVKSIVLPQLNGFEVFRKEENGGNKTYTNIEDLFDDYKSGALHPADLKPALSRAINKILQPMRERIRSDNAARELLKSVKVLKSSVKGGTRPSRKGESSEEGLVASVGTLSIDSLHPQEMTPEEMKFKLVRSVGEECIMEGELRNLLSKKANPVCYDGFEPSGRMHIAQGILKAINVNKLTSSGCTVKLWVADWFAKLNNKMGGDLPKIRTVGHYFIEIWKSLGMNLEKVEFLWSSDEIKNRADKYWPRVMDIARRNTLKRIKRCCRIMGRTGEEKLTVAQILYPCMQCADIFFLEADICQLGMDQRKVNVLAREYCDDIKRKNKPIILSHHMLPGLREGQEKMSKSDPSSAIFMEDTEEDVNFKIMQAYCPPKVLEGNPCLEYVSYIIFPRLENNFEVLRKEENGGYKIYTDIEELFEDYKSGALCPDDLKPALAKAINTILQPVRDHFTTNTEAKDLLAAIKGYRVTR